MTRGSATPLLATFQATIFRQRYFLIDEEDKKISELAQAVGLTGEFKSEFEANALWLCVDLKRRQKLAELPEKPLRDYRHLKEDLISYLTSEQGTGPWIEANVLTMPLLRNMAPLAYKALIYYLRHNELPVGVSIPSKYDETGEQVEIMRRKGVDFKSVMSQASKTWSRLNRALPE